MKSFITKLSIIILFILVFIKRDIMYYTIYNSTLLWFKNIVPNILPMFILSSLIVSSNLIYDICNIFGEPFKKIFKVSIYGFYVFILSLVTGSPSNAKYILDLKDNNLISKSEQDKLLMFTLNYNPLLIVSLLSIYLSRRKSIMILLIIILSNIIVGILNRNIKIDEINNINKFNKINLSSIIKNTIDTLFMILGTIIFFNILINVIPIRNNLIKNILKGMLEITSGLKSLEYLDVSENLKILLCIIYLSFGGLSIHTQIKSILPDTNYKMFLKGRLFSLIISIILFICFYKMGYLIHNMR